MNKTVSIKVKVDTIYIAQTLVYKIKDDAYELLASSPKVFDGNIDLDQFGNLIFRKIGDTDSLKGWTLLVVTFLNHLPDDIKTGEDLKTFVLDPNNATSLDYWVKKDDDIMNFQLTEDDTFSMKINNEGRILKKLLI
ncbi:hypothetical protein [Flavobacterium phycosphaerae]|uniref:hypothetical protein n=1 Tax=Flavobacterium phycosphaerae TaxID=2697515 RepID=UPI001389B361|nr:hypothetical protein [Flavobacterium phycosphaerae]